MPKETKKASKEPEQNETPPAETSAGVVNETSAPPVKAVAATETPQDVTVPVEGTGTTGTAATTADGEKKAKATKPEVPEHLKKGNRVCASCDTPEADFLKKNPRYSLCQGVDVLCYRKGDRVIYGQTIDQVNEKYADKVGKTDDKGRPLIQEVSGNGIKPGILVRGAIKYSRKSSDTASGTAGAGTVSPAETSQTATPTSTAAVESGTGSANTTTAG